MALVFRWNDAKAISNVIKHRDEEHSQREKRYILLGETHEHRLVVVSHVERGSVIRLATRRERRTYEES